MEALPQSQQSTCNGEAPTTGTSFNNAGAPVSENEQVFAAYHQQAEHPPAQK